MILLPGVAHNSMADIRAFPALVLLLRTNDCLSRCSAFQIEMFDWLLAQNKNNHTQLIAPATSASVSASDIIIMGEESASASSALQPASTDDAQVKAVDQSGALRNTFSLAVVGASAFVISLLA